MKIKIVTAIYSNLYGTDLGGRPNRYNHYRYSLLAILNMSNADFVCYTEPNEYEDLCNFFHKENSINNIEIKKFDLKNFNFSSKINLIKDFEEIKKSDRCFEIQYCKFIWVLDEAKIGGYDYFFWFDAGLSHSGLFPPKYMTEGDYWSIYYKCVLFNNKFLNNLVNFSNEKIFVCAKENVQNFWSNTLPIKYYSNYSNERHVIGGIFGGSEHKVIDYCTIFLDYLDLILNQENKLYFEENIMSLIFYNHNDLFNYKYFDIWWHEEERVPGIDMKEYTSTRKSFYKIIEELNE